MRVIGMLMGIPEEDQAQLRDHYLDFSKHHASAQSLSGSVLAEYVDWRVDYRSDDVMTVVMNTEFEDEQGTRSPYLYDELLSCLTWSRVAGRSPRRSSSAGSPSSSPTTPTSVARSSTIPRSSERG